jgi:hypothetical protein
LSDSPPTPPRPINVSPNPPPPLPPYRPRLTLFDAVLKPGLRELLRLDPTDPAVARFHEISLRHLKGLVKAYEDYLRAPTADVPPDQPT